MLQDFVRQWYVEPIINNTGYNPVNTATYGIILITTAILVFYALKKFRISINEKFFISLVPFIFLGAMLRAFEDLLEASDMTLGFLTLSAIDGPRNMLLVSPVIYITMFAITAISLFISLVVSRITKISYDRILFSIGTLGALSVLVVLAQSIIDFFALGVMFSLGTSWGILLFAFRKYVAPKYQKLKFFTKENTLIIATHMFDASTTFTAIQFYPYFEQHFLPRFFISFMGPAVMFFLKLAVVPLALYYIDKEIDNRERRIFFKLLVLILGLGPGLRNFFRLIMGV